MMKQHSRRATENAESGSPDPSRATSIVEAPAPRYTLGVRAHAGSQAIGTRIPRTRESVLQAESVHVRLSREKSQSEIEVVCHDAVGTRGEIDMGCASELCLFQSMRDEQRADSSSPAGRIDHDIFDPSPHPRWGDKGYKRETGDQTIIVADKEEVGRGICSDQSEMLKRRRNGA